MIMRLVDLQIAARSLAQHRLRTVFLGAAVAAVTALLVLLMGLTTGIREMILRSGSTLMTGHVNVGGFYKPSAGTSAPLVTDYEKVVKAFRDRVPELDYMVNRGRGYAKGVSDTSSMDLVLGGIEIASESGFRNVVRVSEGSLDELAKPNTILLFEIQAKRLSAKVGDSLTLSAPTSRGINNTVDVRVAAIARDIGMLSAWNAYIPAETLRRLYQLKPGSTGAIQLYLNDFRDSPQVAARLRGVLADAGFRMMDPDPEPYYMKLLMKVNREDWTGQKIDVSTWEDELSFASQLIGILDGLIGLLVIILILIVGAGIMTTLWIAIRERTREIGTLRAIGMQRTKVAQMFLLEGAMLGLVGTMVGGLGGALLAALINQKQITLPEGVQVILMSDHLFLSVHWTAVAGAVIGLTLITAAAALYPSIRAARLKPVTAMHHIG
jgi:ABC-type lipoprotein release transport system permease subunit